MQAVGFAHALEPALDPDDSEALVRHTAFFNTHPFMVSAILGCVAKLEGQGQAAAASNAKAMFMGPFGGLGDTFFWGGLKVFLAVSAVVLSFAGNTWAPWAFVGVWTLLELAARAWFFRAGYRGGPEALLAITRLGLVKWSSRFKLGAAALLGVWLWKNASAGSAMAKWGMAIPLAVFVSVILALGISWAIRKEANPLWIIYGCAITAVGIGAML